MQIYFRQSCLAICISQIDKYNLMKESLLLMLGIFLLIGSMVIATGIQSTEGAKNLNSSKSNIYRAITTQTSGDNSPATFQVINVDQDRTADNNCSGGAECSNSISNNNGDLG